MKILIIGGTKFLGRHLVAAAQAQGHTVTLFHRGRNPAAGLADAEEIFGSRHADLTKLRHRSWDAVVDTCGYLPAAVRATARALRGAVGQYAFISSVSAYADFPAAGYDETAPLATLTADQAARARQLEPTAEVTAAGLADLYGGLKAECEQAVREAFGPAALLVRPGLLVGPFDPTDRFTYWAHRLQRGGEVLVPGRPARPVQLLDARDAADWIIGLLARQGSGAYNIAGRPGELTFAGLVETARAVSASSASFTWVSEEFLQQQAVAAWSEMPLYLPEASPETRGFFAARINRALATGLQLRPLAETIRDTLVWRATQPAPLQAGLDAAREQHLLRQWHRRSAE